MYCFGSGCYRLSCQTLSSATPFKCSLIIFKVVAIGIVEEDEDISKTEKKQSKMKGKQKADDKDQGRIPSPSEQDSSKNF